jgi:hypothetical protein
MAMMGRCFPLVCSPGADGGCGGDSVHFGHLDVHEYEIELSMVKRFEGVPARFGHRHAAKLFFEQVDGDLLVYGVVFSEQDSGSGRTAVARYRVSRGRIENRTDGRSIHRQRDGERECAALARFARYFELASHQIYQLGRNRKAKTAASVFAAG